ncbi:hypothetical protein [Liquorilactobacillus mali]|uniref:Integral membrane protein n=1 Tax=Liquorilactobacillus mali KCTC 3596 = DSM 20444 TaxID=1046596 RepID=J1F4N8_9LACO|nr:hypothetical protein [Liquorilactobacillus mali]EJF00809.1 hypothetical protein LMA_02598 [Liquorilactobacillus mali KCTC 3596 = DSM 20444]KRN11609.1 hypothetical protein FD00_GL000142 [Liquorilactobacillus mali KCTC 3596 = DSM 20444]QFQ74352.1 hypothetical protein LM596_04070 [Liquorilactobacillus mali]
MKTTKLVFGILMIVLSVFIGLQSMVTGLGNSLESNNQHGGSAGILVGILYLVAGIVYLATKSAKKLGADIANFILLALAWLLGVSNAGSYGDLTVWGWLALIIGALFLVWHILSNKKAKNVVSK